MNTPHSNQTSPTPVPESRIARWIVDSYHRWTGRRLLPEAVCELEDEKVTEALFELPAVVVSHDTRPNPVFQYGNRAALNLFEMSREELLTLPSRFSAEPGERAEREAMLKEVNDKGFSDSYSGVRISSTGKRFRIEQATVWNLVDARGEFRGQAATFANWTDVEEACYTKLS